MNRAGRRTHERLLQALSGDPPAQIHLQGEQLPREARALLKAHVGLWLQRAKSEAALEEGRFQWGGAEALLL